MREFFRTDIRQHAFGLLIRHRIALIQVTHGRAQFAVWTAGLQEESMLLLRVIMDGKRVALAIKYDATDERAQNFVSFRVADTLLWGCVGWF